MYEPKPLNYTELGVDAPSVDIHQEPELIKPKGPWKQRGNHIYREAEGLNYGSRIPTTHYLAGTDDKGLPILKKLNI